MAAKSKLIVTANCRFEGNHLEKGTVIEVDLESKKETGRIAPLVHAGRMATWSPEVEKAIKAELAAEAKQAKALDDRAAGKAPKAAATE